MSPNRTSHTDNRGNPENLVPEFAELAKALEGADLPLGKEELLQQAEDNGADDDILSLIEQLPEQEYATMADIIEEAGRLRAAGAGDEME